ncbi:MAG TPA: DNA cytosine methyltransferase [Acetobacteraceae bacterium]|nr:DNA cytosine methyltransferase [Acetobacteraceae bacterium]
MASTALEVVSRPSVTAVDLFCGAGGLSFGLKESGIRIAAGIDLDPACRYAFERNIAASFLEWDVAALQPQAVEALFSTAEVRLLAGCAPCQPFSGYTTRRRGNDRRWRLLLDFLRIVRSVGPEIVTLENVPRLAHLSLWDQFVVGLRESGYHVAWDIINASRYGVPQTRRRLVLLASKLGEIQIPPPVTAVPPTVRSAIGTLPHVSAGERAECDPLHSARALTLINMRRIQASRPAGTWREWPPGMRVRCHKTKGGKTYPSVYGRMSWDRPSPTITTQFYGFGNGRFGHPEQHRAITLREGAMLQSFPLGFQFVPPGTKINFREIGRLIGNAVPPELARVLGHAITDHVTYRSK